MNFSVLQSVYAKDNPQFLAEALQSIADSTAQPLEIVLVKDGVLTTALENVIAEWKQKLPLTVIGYEQNKGLIYALNYGMQFVKTELVARMDSDDICFSERFEKQLLQFEIDKSLVVLGTGIEEFYEKENTTLRQIRLYPKCTTKKSLSLYKGTPLAHPSVMIRTDILRKFRYNESAKCNEDIDLWFRILRAGYEIRTLQIPLLYFRITEDTFKRRSLTKVFNEFYIYSYHLFKLHGFTIKHLYLCFRFASRFAPKCVVKRLYLSSARKELFKENLMNIKSINGQVFIKGGHVFEALLEVEENGSRIIKAVQLDSDGNNIVELPADEVKLYSLKNSADIQLHL